MQKPAKHIMVCASFRANGTPQGACFKKNAPDLLQYLESELNDRGMTDVMVSMTGCLKVCDRGPAMIVYPDGHWYGNVDESAIDEILDAMEQGKAAEQYLMK
ncbi:MAG: (2Fe-2S) ferredoxin domain-containing protein [Bacillota bacterium]